VLDISRDRPVAKAEGGFSDAEVDLPFAFRTHNHRLLFAVFPAAVKIAVNKSKLLCKKINSCK
jgi:hypothetical protein